MPKNWMYLKVCTSYITRQGLKSLANSLSPLKRTKSAISVHVGAKHLGDKLLVSPKDFAPNASPVQLWLLARKFISGRLIRLAAIFVLSLTFVACSGTSQNLSNPISSPAATETTNRESAQKVVALTPLTADIIYQLEPTKIVGVTGSKIISNDPRFKGITTVSGEQTPPNLEKIVALKPDFAVGAAGFHDKTMERLQQLAIKTLLTQVKSWKALEELTVNLARSLNADPEPLLKRYQTFLADIPQGDYSTLILVSRQPILSPNQASWAGDFLQQFKLKNLAAQLQGTSPLRGYVTLSPEKILQANPEIILLVETGDKILEKFKSDSFWNQLQAVKNNRVYVFDYYGLVNPGSIDSIEKACSQLKQILETKS